MSNLVNLPSGCFFHPRCRYAKDKCKEELPTLKDCGNGHFSACHFANELDLLSPSKIHL
ncbi:MAG: oligopeptide/dipeptide ABC transporter ATP-binding protein [SAR324 cluster bacterium]|nr:oligopeptide/dipeptide ABC transporter ATP-binding protein [SAR324 cluster bacterium]